jgi:hypothetical protein
MGELISEGYKALLQRTHAESPGWGSGAARRVVDLVPFVRSVGTSTTVMDYGCGKGALKVALLERFPNLRISEYDPGIKGKDTAPEPVDFLISTDVLEHVEDPAAVLRHMRALTLDRAFLCVGLGPAKKFLPDGRNAHLHQLSSSQWQVLIEAAGFEVLESYGTLKHWIFFTR